MAPSITRRRKWIAVGIILTSLAVVTGIYRIVATAVEKVAAGQGHLTYRTVWLYEVTWSGVLVAMAAAVIVILIGVGFSLREWWLWRDLERKYGGKRYDRQ